MTNHPNRAKHFYIRFNHFGSPISCGFLNSWSAMFFDSRADRDAYVARWEGKDQSIRICTRAEALKYAERLDGDLFLRGYEPILFSRDVKPSLHPLARI
jgi:hypothetical protein